MCTLMFQGGGRFKIKWKHCWLLTVFGWYLPKCFSSFDFRQNLIVNQKPILFSFSLFCANTYWKLSLWISKIRFNFLSYVCAPANHCLYCIFRYIEIWFWEFGFVFRIVVAFFLFEEDGIGTEEKNFCNFSETIGDL